MTGAAPAAARRLSARYRVGALLGRGGMAEVYDGYDERLHRPVAVKLLQASAASDPGIRERFEVEARAAARLTHPNVVAVYDTGEDAGTPFIIMERLPGETLADRMAAGPVDAGWLRQVALDVLGALGAAHAAGIVHRDVKPGNILIGPDGHAKVADFGIAKSVEFATDATGAGLVIGTPAYLSPERVEGRPATGRSDLYSLGVVLYEALAGVKPFDGPTPVAVADAVLHAEVPPLGDARPDLDPVFVAAVERAFSREPTDRPASAEGLAAELMGRDGVASTDPTVALRAGRPGGEMGAGRDLSEPTLVGVPAAGSPPGTGPAAGPAHRILRRLRVDRLRSAGPARPGLDSPVRARWVALGAVAACVLGGLVALALAGGTRGGGQAALAADIRALAGRIRAGAGPQGPVASERLVTVAGDVGAGGGADDANALLADAGQWAQEGRLSAAATADMATLLARIHGVDATLATLTTTTAPVTTTSTTEVVATSPAGTRGRRHRKEGGD